MKMNKKLISLTIFGGLIFPMNAFALQKSETIYSTLNYKGDNIKTTVSNHLSFIDQSQIEDETELKNILNIGGIETFSLNGKKLTWNTQDKDIFYEGETEKKSPIEVSFKYFLNNEEKEVTDILGLSGKIKIQMTFSNKEEKKATINGHTETLYTPFVTTIGTILNSKNNKNISISNGKVVSTGSRHMVVGLASPGLYESIGLQEFKNLNEITIEYETTKFELNNIYIVSTPKLLESSDLEIFDKMDDLYMNVSELQKNMNTLEKGILELSSGIEKINNGSSELVSSLKAAAEGAKKVQKGSGTLKNGLYEMTKALNIAKKELKKLDMSSFDSVDTLKGQNTNTINTLLKTTGMNLDQLKSFYEKYKLQSYKGSDEKMIALKNAYEMVVLLQTNNMALEKSTSTLKTLIAKLDSLISTSETAIGKLTSGSESLNSGIVTLKSGIDKIYAGSVTLNNGTKELVSGAKTLQNGAQKFNKQGIGTLSNYAYTLKNYSDKAEYLVNLSQEYNGFASNNSNQILFVSKVESAKLTYKK